MTRPNSSLFAATQAKLLRRARTEATLDIDTTIANTEGSTDDASGAHANTEVAGQTAKDAGKSAVNPTVNADRGPGDMAPGVKESKTKPAKKASVTEKASTVGLFPGCLVKVVEISSNKTVERHVAVTKVNGKVITVKGGDEYDQDKYSFVRLS